MFCNLGGLQDGEIDLGGLWHGLNLGWAAGWGCDLGGLRDGGLCEMAGAAGTEGYGGIEAV